MIWSPFRQIFWASGIPWDSITPLTNVSKVILRDQISIHLKLNEDKYSEWKKKVYKNVVFADQVSYKYKRC